MVSSLIMWLVTDVRIALCECMQSGHQGILQLVCRKEAEIANSACSTAGEPFWWEQYVCMQV